MSDKPETLAAVLAEFRAFAMRAADEDKTISPESILLLADKVEAAAERERRKYESLHECFWSDAAIQNIVRQLLDERNDLRNQNPKASEVAAHFAQLLEKAATRSPGNAAAPARNCDRFATAAKAMHEWERYKATAPIPTGGWCLGDAFAWLFDKAEGGDHV